MSELEGDAGNTAPSLFLSSCRHKEGIGGGEEKGSC